MISRHAMFDHHKVSLLGGAIDAKCRCTFCIFGVVMPSLRNVNLCEFLN